MPVVYKNIAFWQGVLAPAMIVVTAAMLRLGTGAMLIAALLSLLSWWTGGMRWYHTAGMTQYVASAYLTIPFVAAMVQACTQPTWLRVLSVAAWAAVGMFMHPLFPIGAALIGSVWMLSSCGSLRNMLRAIIVVVFVGAVMCAANWVWILGSMNHLMANTYQQPYQRDVLPALALQEMLGIARTAAGGTRLALALVLGSVLALVLCRQTRHRQIVVGLAAGAVLTMTWASLGALLPPVASLQPNRFSTLAWISLILPASLGMAAASRAVRTLTGTRRAVIGVALAICTVVVVWFVRETGRELLAPPGSGRYAVAPPEVKDEGPMTREIARFLRDHTSREARVFFELSQARIHDGAHVVGWLAMTQQREFIGGPYPHSSFASAWDNQSFGGRNEDRTPEQWLALLDAYNVRWMICHTESCRHAMNQLPGTTKLADWGRVTAYGRKQSAGFVHQGEAQVTASCVNRVELSGVAGEPVVLRYSWVPGLRAHPSGRVEPVHVVPGGRPFVAIHNPPSQLVLRVGEGAGTPCSQRDSVWK
ncbi:MAG: hypothetical protein AW12_02191 [Candidatus Accumulibacter sp. BA-94]|nr:MAG: hypothetical protein AW12_02191 [Candidatus Accumulibacter sp. BA-94]